MEPVRERGDGGGEGGEGEGGRRLGGAGLGGGGPSDSADDAYRSRSRSEETDIERGED